MIRLFTTAFPESSHARRAEYTDCLRRNVACDAVDEICILVEGEVDFIPDSGKVRSRTIVGRPAYDDYFAWINEVAEPVDISLVANADIYFDERIGILAFCGFSPTTAFALSRWEVRLGGEATLNDRNDSQDAWVFKGQVSGVNGDFPIGVPRCDNRIARELEISGYEVLNPAFSIRAYHLHAGTRGEYAADLPAGFVPPPYMYMWPHNLWSLPRTVVHNLLHRNARAGWRLDTRLWSRRLRLHWLTRPWRAIGAKFNGVSNGS